MKPYLYPDPDSNLEATVIGHSVLYLPSKTFLDLVPDDIIIRHGLMYLVLAEPEVLTELLYDEKECQLMCWDFRKQQVRPLIGSSRDLWRYISGS